jgi:hypothetical protein
MAWPAGKHRHSTDAARFVRALLAEFSFRELARLCGVSPRTIQRWASGEDWPTAEAMHRLVDRLFPLSAGAGPIYSPQMALDGHTRVGGVGQYTIEAARGCAMRPE